MITPQEEAWAGEFGREYADRNPRTAEQMDEWTEATYGISRSKLNEQFLGHLSPKRSILEVGSNVGTQLELLQQEMGFENLSGVELNWDAVKLAHACTRGINFWHGSAFDLPFEQEEFDLVFTSGLLIHIHPNKLITSMDEIYRCTSKYIWGFEYYAEEPTPIPYRKRNDLLWKRDFAQFYLDEFIHLRLVKKELIPQVDSDNVDCMFLLEKC